MSKTAHTNTDSENDEVDLLALAKTIWINRRKVLRTTLVFAVLGLTIALLLPKTFTATSTFIPQTAESGKAPGSLGGLASLAGISLGGVSGGSEVPPSLYPKFVAAVPFRRALLEAKVSLPGSTEKVTYKTYYSEIHSPGLLDMIKEYTLGLSGKIAEAFQNTDVSVDASRSDENFLRVSKEELDLFGILEDQLTVKPNEKEGFVSISFDMPDPMMAAQMASYAEALLQKEVIAYKIQNAREQLKFTEEQFEEKRAAFEKIQAELATFRDRNQNIISAAVNNELQRMEAEYNFAFNLYTEHAKQLEQARLQVSKDTPIFSVIEPVTVPSQKSGPKRALILVIFILFGIVISVGYIFGAMFLQGIKEQWSQM